jgi:DNA-binding helix-hairpin-helix protein with protein kinase domain
MSLKVGDLVHARVSGHELSVKKKLGEGTQGVAYLVEGPDGQEVVKWYFRSQGTSAQREAIESLVNRGRPRGKGGERFVWPKDIVTSSTDTASFGYLMPVIDTSRFVELNAIQAKRHPQPNIPELCKISYHIADSFHDLHLAGYCYRDISLGNLLFDPRSGEVLICDNDNVGIDRHSESAILGTPEFMAPEVIRNEKSPSTTTDLHSLAVLLFNLWMWHHPFHGIKEYQIRSWDIPAKTKIYGTEPVFVFDPEDSSNRLPDEPGYLTAFKRWKICPPSLKKAFTTSFTRGLREPGSRVTEGNWKRIFASLHDNRLKCRDCGAINLWSEGIHVLQCWHCETEISVPMRIVVNNGNGKMPLLVDEGRKVLARHVNPADDHQPDAVVGEIVRNPKDPTVFGLKNHTERPWIVAFGDDVQKEVPPGRSAPLNATMKLNLGAGAFVTIES